MKSCFRLFAAMAVLSGQLTSGLMAENTAALNDVLKLKHAGIAESTIIAFIQTKNAFYDLSADQLVRLREQGLSPEILNALLASGAGGVPAPSAFPPSSSSPAPAVVTQPASSGPNVVGSQPPQPTQGSFVPPVSAGPDVSYFYQELSPHGRWFLAEDGQWCWQPAVLVTAPGWRPYWDKGHWIWTDHGWYWASDYAWGWATFHYGRWQLHPHHGWVWFPDRVWGPAWVLWRSGGEYCGWAPLPRGVIYDIPGGRFLFHGRRVEVGFDFGLGLAHFNFCYGREIGEHSRQRLHGEMEGRRIFERTAVLDVRLDAHPGQPRPYFFNRGIEPPRLPGGRGRSLEQVRIEELRTPAPGRAHERLDTRTRTLEVYRPRFGDHR